MAQIDILKEILNYSLRKFNYEIVGSTIIYVFNNERYAKAELTKLSTKNEFNGVTITYISKLHGEIDTCHIFFKDVFLDQKMASINVNISSDEYDWFEQKRPSQRDLYRLALHIERYIAIIGDFGNNLTDYLNMSVLASQAAYHGIVEQQKIEYSIDEQKAITNMKSEKNLIEIEPPDNDVLVDEEPEISAPSDDESEDNSQTHLLEPCQVTENDELESILVKQILENEQETENEMKEPDNNAATKKNLFGFLKNREKNLSDTIELNPSDVLSEPDDIQPQPIKEKSFVSWSIGASKEDNVIASLYETAKDYYCLEVKGSGRMRDFKIVPWAKYADKITSIKINPGITNVGNNAFKSLCLITEVVLPEGITEVGFSSFEFCSQLHTLVYPNSLKTIGSFAFSGTESLKEVSLPDSVVEIKDYAFELTNDFVIKAKDPNRLILGAGLRASDFEMTEAKPKQKLSIHDYIE